MSFTFRDQSHEVGAIVFRKYFNLTASPSGLNGPLEGQVWRDSVSGNLNAFLNGEIVSISGVASVQQTEVEITNPTTATALMTYAFPAGALNIANRVIDVFAAGEYTTDSGTGRTITIAVTLNDGTNTRTLLTWTSGATTASQTSMPWNFDAVLTTAAGGTAGTGFAHGTLNITLGASAAGAMTGYNDTSTVPSSALDLTKAVTLTVTALFGGSNAGNTIEEDLLQVSVA